MKKLLSIVFCLLLIQISRADEITFAVHKNVDSPLHSSKMSLFLFSDPNTSITITSFDGAVNQTITTDSTGKAEVEIPKSQFLETTGPSNKAITISSNSAISAYLSNREKSTSDVSYLLSNSALGTEYYLPTWNDSVGSAQLSFTAIEDNTTVTVTSPVAIPSASIIANTPQLINLDKGETYFIAEDIDFTGLHLSSTQKIAVFSGNQCTNLIDTTCDHLYSQIIPTSMAGTHYLIPETKFTGSVGNVVRVIATSDNTTININNRGAISIETIATAGEYTEIASAYDVEIDSDSPIIVAQYLKGIHATGQAAGDPAMSVIIPDDQWLDSYYYGLPNGTEAFDENYLNIIIEKDANGLANVTLNGVPVAESEFSQLGSTNYLKANLLVDPAIIPLGEISADRSFMLTISGFSNADSFLTIGGAVSSPGISLPPTTAGTRTLEIPSTSVLGLLLTALLLMISVGLKIRRSL